MGAGTGEYGEDAYLRGYDKVHLKLGSHGLFLVKSNEQWAPTLDLLIKAGVQHREFCAIFSSQSGIDAVAGMDVIKENGHVKLFPRQKEAATAPIFDRMYEAFKSLVLEASQTGFQGVRVILDLKGYFGEISSAEMMAFEHAADELLSSHEFPLTLVCAYDLSRLQGTSTLELLDIHAHFILGSVDEEPPFFIRVATRLFRDPLTRLYNLRYLRERLEEETDRIRRYGGHFSVVVGDFDGFQRVNEKFGYIRGDRVLVEAAKILSAAVRKVDLVCRYGDDSFVLLLPETSKSGAQIISERLQQALQKIRLKDLDLWLSVGIATFPDDGRTKEALFQKAVKSLNASKQARQSKMAAASRSRPQAP